jgi:fatty-acyl-CoA synthase
MSTTIASREQGLTTPPLLEMTIGEALERAVRLHGARLAVVSRHQQRRVTYDELGAEVERVARALLAARIEPADRVGIWSPNRVEWMLMQYATARIGAILVTINPAYRTHELSYALAQCGCRLLVAAERFKTSDYAAMIDEVSAELPALERVVLLDTDQWDAFVAQGAAVTKEDVRARALRLRPSDPINIQYTSGTTGRPKGATLSHRNILNNGYFVGEGCALEADDVVCVPVPFYHCFGMVLGNLAAMSHGSAVVLPGEAFEPGTTLEAVHEEHCTALYGVPTMFIAELGHPEFERFDLSSLRTGIMAGAPCPIPVMRAAIERIHMAQVTICYGMTETSPVSTQTARGDDIERRTSTVGRVHPHVEIQVTSPVTGEVVPRGEAGELRTRGYSVMLGYWQEPERTAEAVDPDGWMHTGDLATMDDAGYVRIVGRIKDMIIRGGENIYPREIEEFLLTHAGIDDVHVVGVPDERYGEEVAAFVKPRSGSTLSAEAVRGFCEGRIAHYKIPRYVICVDEFPMTVTGKVQKYLLRARAIEELDLHAAAAIETA